MRKVKTENCHISEITLAEQNLELKTAKTEKKIKEH